MKKTTQMSEQASATLAHIIAIVAVLKGLILIGIVAAWNERLVELIFNNGDPITPGFLGIVALAKILLLFASIMLLGIGLLAIEYHKQLSATIRKNSKIIGNVLALAITLAILLLAGEIVARALIGNQTYDGGGVAHKNQLRSMTYNSLGYRDKEYTIEKPANTVRIIAVGDSFTFGHGISNTSDVWPEVLEQLLNNESAAAYEVINTAKDGYQPKEEIAIINQTQKLQPDIYLLGYFFNDAERDDALLEKRTGDGLTTFGRLKEGAHLYLFSHSYLYNFFRVRYASFKINVGITKGLPQALDEVYRDDPLTIHQEQLLQMHKLAKDANATLIIVIMPGNYDFSNYPLKNGHAFMERFCAKNNISCIDPLPEFMQEDYTKTRLNPYDSHPSVYGHQIIATTVFKSDIFKKALLEKRPQ